MRLSINSACERYLSARTFSRARSRRVRAFTLNLSPVFTSGRSVRDRTCYIPFMQIVRSLENLPPQLRGGSVTIGNFDGVHKGHARLVERLVSHARRVGGPAVVFTFDPHPLALLRPEWLPVPMTRVERKAELLAELGVDAVVAYPTDRALLGLAPEQFFDFVLRQKLDAKAVVEGPNFHFGKDRAGTVDVLRTLCDHAGIACEVVEPVTAGVPPLGGELPVQPAEAGTPTGTIISSSRVRQLIQAGELAAANALLTQPYRLSGIVGRGAARGGTIGFPTANLEQVQTVLPALGVYAGRAWVRGQESDSLQPYAAAVNVGPNPTFGENAVKIEAHLIDYTGNLYDRPLSLDFLERLRDIRPFPSVDALVAQLRQDVTAARDRVG